MHTLPELLRSYNVPFVSYGEHHHASPGWLNIDCPMCGQHGKFRLGLALHGRSANCYVCGVFKVHEILPLILGETPKKASALQKALKPIIGPKIERAAEVKMPKTQKLTNAAQTYLASRGFNPKSLALLWQIRSTGYAGKLARRILIPIHDASGVIVSWTSRQLHDRGFRYVSASPTEETVPHKNLLYGEHLIATKERIIITEGPFDAMKIGPGCVATFGLNVTPQQIQKIRLYYHRIIIFDGSNYAYKTATNLAYKLRNITSKTTIISLEGGVDPGSLTLNEAESIRQTYLK